MLHIHLVRMPAIPRARGISPRHNKTGRPNPGTNNSNTWRELETKECEHNCISYWDDATVRSLRFPARPRTWLQSSLQTEGTGRRGSGFGFHIRKPKPQASIKNKIYEFHKLLNVYNTIHRMIGVGQLRWQCYRRHQQTKEMKLELNFNLNTFFSMYLECWYLLGIYI